MKKIIIFNNKKEILNFFSKIFKNSTNIVLSGGNSINIFHKFYKNNQNKFKKIFLSDERIVKQNSLYRNDKKLKKIYKKKIIGFKNFSSRDLYEYNKKILIYNPQIAVLGLGINNHIAGIFDILNNPKTNLIFTQNFLKKPKKRISLSLFYLSKLNKIIVLVQKKRKKEINNIFAKKKSPINSLKPKELIIIIY